MNKKEIGLMLRSTLIEKGLLIRFFSRTTGISMPQLYRIFNGENYTIDQFLKVLEELDLNISITKKGK